MDDLVLDIGVQYGGVRERSGICPRAAQMNVILDIVGRVPNLVKVLCQYVVICSSVQVAEKLIDKSAIVGAHVGAGRLPVDGEDSYARIGGWPSMVRQVARSVETSRGSRLFMGKNMSDASIPFLYDERRVWCMPLLR